MPKYTNTKTGQTFNSPKPLSADQLEELFSLGSQIPKPVPFIPSSTAVNIYPKPQVPQRMGLLETAKMFMPTGASGVIQGMYSSPRKQAEAVQNVVEYGLPILAAPLTGGWSIPAAAGLGGVGSVLGQQAKDLMLGERTPNQELLQRGITSAVLTGAGQGIGVGATKFIGGAKAPFASTFDAPTEELAKKYGIETTASMVNKSRAVPLVEALSGKSLFGDRLRQVVQNAEQKVTNVADNLVNKIGNADATEAGLAIKNGIQRTEKTFYETKDVLYNAAQLKKGDVKINPQRTIQILDETIARLEDVAGKKPAILSKLKQLRSGLDPNMQMSDQLKKQGFNPETIQKIMQQKSGGQIPVFKNSNEAIAFGEKATPQQVEKLKQLKVQAETELKPLEEQYYSLPVGQRPRELAQRVQQAGSKRMFYREAIESYKGEGIDGVTALNTIRALKRDINFADKNPITQGYDADLRKVSVTLQDEFDNALGQSKPEIADALKKANSFYKENIQKLNTGYGKKIQQLVDAGQYDKISSAILNRNTSIQDIPKIFEVVGDEAKNNIKANLLQNLIGESKRNANQVFTANMLDKTIKQFGEQKLAAIYTPEELNTLKDIAKLSTSIGYGQRVAEGSQTTFLARLAGLTGMAFIEPITALRLFMGDAAISRFIASPTGQQWLKQGFKMSPITQYAIPSATRVAGQRLGAQ